MYDGELSENDDAIAATLVVQIDNARGIEVEQVDGWIEELHKKIPCSSLSSIEEDSFVTLLP